MRCMANSTREQIRQTHRLDELLAQLKQSGRRPESVAADVNVSLYALKRWRKGLSVIPSNKLVPLATSLGVTVEYLMGWDEPNGTDDAKAA